MVSEKQGIAKRKNDQKPEEPKVLVKKEYTDEERIRIAKYLERLKREPVKLKINQDDSGNPRTEHITTDGALSMVRFAEALGTTDIDLQYYLLNQVVRTFSGCVSSERFAYDRLEEFANNAIALLNGIQPQDEIEGMLAIQMIAVHNMAMETIKRAMITGQTFEGTEANVNHATKLLRTFTAQVETLKRYRTGGQQKVTVEHVHVNEGGQAIVGMVNRGEGNSGKQE
jgi:hypothetical protein